MDNHFKFIKTYIKKTVESNNSDFIYLDAHIFLRFHRDIQKFIVETLQKMTRCIICVFTTKFGCELIKDNIIGSIKDANDYFNEKKETTNSISMTLVQPFTLNNVVAACTTIAQLTGQLANYD
jgi:hypothetical protein